MSRGSVSEHRAAWHRRQTTLRRNVTF